MEVKFYTFSCLVLFIVLHKEVDGKIELVPNSLPLTIDEEFAETAEKSVQLLDYDPIKEYCEIDPSSGSIQANFKVVTPTEIDHLEYPIKIKLGENEMSFNGTVEKITDTDRGLLLENKNIKKNQGLYLFVELKYNNLDATEGDKGSVTVSVQGVDENGKVDALWGVIADAVAK